MSKTVVLTLVLTSLAGGQVREPMSVAGQVRDFQARKVAGAEVAVMALSGDGFNHPKSAKELAAVKQTDRDGRFAFEVWVEPKHDVLVVARKSGLALGWAYIYKEHPFLAEAGVDRTIDIILEKPYEAAGRIVDAEGKAVAGAKVQAVPYIRNGAREVYAPRDWFSTHTDAQGRFVFDDLSIDAVVKFHVETSRSDIVHIYPPEAKLGNASGGYRVDDEDVKLSLPWVATVQGRVVDRDTGFGIEGIRLLLNSDPLAKTGWPFRSVTLYSHPSGRFELNGVPPGEHLLRLVAPATGQQAWVARNVIVKVERSKRPAEAKVVIEKGRPLEVMIRDKATGRAVPGVNVQIDDRWDLERQDVFLRVTETDTNGIAHLVVPQEKLKIHVFGNNYTDGLKAKGTRIDMTRPRTTPVEILVQPRLPLVKGTVVDPLGQPIANTPVTIGGGQSVLTDSQGKFVGKQNPLYPSHLVVARDVKRNLVGMAFFHDALRELRVALKPGSTVRGRVTDEMGRSIPGARVYLRLEKRMRRPTDPSGLAQMTETRTDSEGYYRLENVWPLQGDYYYRMSVYGTDFGPTEHLVDERMESGAVITNPDMRLLALDASVSGVVVDKRANPVAHKHVYATSDTGGDQVNRSTYTDEQGRFKFKRLANGLVSLQVGYARDPEHASVTAHSGDHVNIVLGAAANAFVMPSPLVGCPLPDLRTLEIGFDDRRVRNKKILVFFVDYTQRTSQLEIRYLNNIRYHLRRNNIELVCIQVRPAQEAELKAWKKKNKIAIPIEMMPGGGMESRSGNLRVLKNLPDRDNPLKETWGVRSLPWTVLADENQKIMATGFQASRIFLVVPPKERPLSSRSRARRRR